MDPVPRASGRRRILSATLAAAFTFALSAFACAAGPRITFIPDGGTYTSEEAQRMASSLDLSPASGLTADEAPSARRAALAKLREDGAEASAFADVLTRTFPEDTRSVPVLAEAATVDGRQVWIVVEAWGGREGPLDGRRTWLLDRETGQVISSVTGD